MFPKSRHARQPWSQAARRPTFFRPRLEGLESRCVPATYTVSNAQDSGAGSLRQAILDANSNGGSDTIQFNLPGSGLRTIYLFTSLPTITGSVVLDGASQSGYAGTPLIEINGSNLGQTEAGLAIGESTGLSNSADSSMVRALRISSFQGNGLNINAAGCLIQGNEIVRNTGIGLATYRYSGSSSLPPNAIRGNFIGIDSQGSAGQGNSTGISLEPSGGFGAASATIGGPTAGDRNVISGNGIGIDISPDGVIVQGNFIGTDPSGTLAVPNSTGVKVGYAGDVLIGGTSSGARNIISGNTHYGISYEGTGSPLPGLIQGNFIGTDVTGTMALGNGDSGIFIANRAVLV